MPHTCTRCARPNPDEARFCYFDGVALATTSHSAKPGAAAPIQVNQRDFQRHFVLPGGQQCRNFDELAVACQQNWATALDQLRSGAMEKFLAGIDRADLAQAARHAAQLPDKDRGLDQFLARLPSKAVREPRLQATPMDLNLGTIKPGEDRGGTVQLKNLGMRLLYGSITIDGAPWLTLGKAPGARQKLFQFGSDLKVPINVRGKALRAGNKPLEGRLIIESNGGSFEIPIQAEVPVRPFPDGVLAGARSPRQIAEKARTHPKEAAMLFEKGKVAKWYKDNGWTYPVKGPAASGLGAVQQYFEALGLTPPPRVGVGTRRVELTGQPGVMVTDKLEIKAEEKRPVFAHAVSDQPWLEVGRAVLNGRVATIPLRVSNVPDRVGETLHAQVAVTANGNQRFVVPVTLKIGPGGAFMPLTSGFTARPAVRGTLNKVHLLPLVLLLLSLFGIFVCDLMKSGDDERMGIVIGPGGIGGIREKQPEIVPLDYINRIHVLFSEQQRFGLICPRLRDPRNREAPKLLTRDPRGITNNTCVRIEGYEYLFGVTIPGVHYVSEHGRLLKEVPIPGKDKDRAWMSVWESEFGRIRIAQTIEIVVGEQTRLFDTALVKYHIWNRDTNPHTVGLRVMLDTFIGLNDGVPFYIPETDDKPARLVDKMEIFGQKDIPPFIQALENGTQLADENNTLAVVGLKIRGAEPMEKMVICRWPQNSEARWGGTNAPGDWAYEPMDKNPNAKDSAVVMYWQQTNMKPKEQRTLAFTYGLGRIMADLGTADPADNLTSGRMRLFVGKASMAKPFVATAYVRSSDASQTVKLRLPAGLHLAPGQRAEQTVPAVGPSGYSQVTWKLQATQTGAFVIEADAPSIGTVGVKVLVRETSLFDG